MIPLGKSVGKPRLEMTYSFQAFPAYHASQARKRRDDRRDAFVRSAAIAERGELNGRVNLRKTASGILMFGS